MPLQLQIYVRFSWFDLANESFVNADRFEKANKEVRRMPSHLHI